MGHEKEKEQGKIEYDHGIPILEHTGELDDDDPERSLEKVQDTLIDAIQQGQISVSPAEAATTTTHVAF